MSSWKDFLTTPIPVATGDPIPSRKDLLSLEDEEMFLYLQGLQRFQAVDATNPLSFFQIAGIHGRPYTTWPPNQTWDNGIKQFATNSGFCTHSSVLFLTWHRPYLALFESALYFHVNQVAKDIDPSSPGFNVYQKAAKNFRMPYWDWARKDVQRFPAAALTGDAYPNNTSFFKSANFKGPKMKSGIKTAQDYNPLFTFPFPKGTESGITNGFTSTARYPNPPSGDIGMVAKIQAWIQRGHAPRSDIVTTKDGIISRNTERNLSERVAYILKAYQKYIPMSNNFLKEKQLAGDAGVWGSLEDIHNSVHGLVGGTPGGHMGSIATSAFDPIFWLHHTNIDRLFAIWQALQESPDNKETYVQARAAPYATFAFDGTKQEDQNTPLYPFRRTAESTKDSWWTSETSKRTTAFNYVYPETEAWTFPSTSEAQQKLADRISNYYSTLGEYVVQSKQKIPTAGAAIVPQAALLKRMAAAKAPATISAMSHIEQQLPTPMALLDESNEPGKPVLRRIARDNKYLEWIFNVKAEKHAMDGNIQVHVFMGAVEEENVALWPFSPNHIGAFVTLGQDKDTACEKCKEDQANNVEVSGQIPLTLALAERYLAEMIPDLSPDTVIPYLQQNLHWRVSLTSGGTVPDRGTVPGLKVFVISNEVTLSDNPNVRPVYADEVTIHPEITTKPDGSPRGEGSGLAVGEV